jgi:hypothetical protein
LTQTNPIDTKALAEQAKASIHKETYRLLEKNHAYRIGVGARANLPDASSFFVEVIINLSPKNGEVDLWRLEKTLSCLKKLKTKGYSLTYEDGNCISCETTKPIQNLNEEYTALKSLKKTFNLRQTKPKSDFPSLFETREKPKSSPETKNQPETNAAENEGV